MKKILWSLVAMFSLFALYTTVFHTDWIVDPTFPKAYALASDKCTDNCLPNPDRNYFDAWGNEFDYQGNLIHAVCPNAPDPISGKDNPECVCPPSQYLQGYGKDTNAAVCHDNQQPVENIPTPVDNSQPVFEGK